MTRMFIEKEDYAFLHKIAQESQGEEKQRKKELVEPQRGYPNQLSKTT